MGGRRRHDRRRAPAPALRLTAQSSADRTAAIARPASSEVIGSPATTAARIVASRVDRDRSRLQLTFEFSGLDPQQIPAFSTTLLEKPEIAEAVVELGLGAR